MFRFTSYCFTVCFAVLSIGSQSVHAHFPVWLLDDIYPSQGETISAIYAYGHPFEREYEDVDRPSRVYAINPAGVVLDLADELEETEVIFGEESASSWEVLFSPNARGDYILAADSAVVVGRTGEAWQEFLKVIVHVERSRGWRNLTGQPLEIVPLTRPYALKPGTAFSAQALSDGQPLADQVVYIEKLNETVPETLPPGRYIAHEAVTDPNGVFTTTLHEQGWWVIAVYSDSIGEIEHDGETRPLNGAGVLMVYIEE